LRGLFVCKLSVSTLFINVIGRDLVGKRRVRKNKKHRIANPNTVKNPTPIVKPETSEWLPDFRQFGPLRYLQWTVTALGLLSLAEQLNLTKLYGHVNIWTKGAVRANWLISQSGANLPR
jgi:hypothetical protein